MWQLKPCLSKNYCYIFCRSTPSSFSVHVICALCDCNQHIKVTLLLSRPKRPSAIKKETSNCYTPKPPSRSTATIRTEKFPEDKIFIFNVVTEMFQTFVSFGQKPRLFRTLICHMMQRKFQGFGESAFP